LEENREKILNKYLEKKYKIDENIDFYLEKNLIAKFLKISFKNKINQKIEEIFALEINLTKLKQLKTEKIFQVKENEFNEFNQNDKIIIYRDLSLKLNKLIHYKEILNFLTEKFNFSEKDINLIDDYNLNNKLTYTLRIFFKIKQSKAEMNKIDQKIKKIEIYFKKKGIIIR
jgi:hypothetical protein